MHVSPEDLQFCLRQADTIAHDFQLNAPDPSNPVRNIKDVLDTFERALGCKVKTFEVPIRAEEGWVMGMCILSADNNIEVALASDLNECWGRFVLCKELFHQALDRAEYRNISIAGHIEEYTLAFPDDESKPRKPVVAEFLAEVGAMEVLFPYRDRVAILRDGVRPDFAFVAERFKVPKVFVQRYMSPSYLEHVGRYSSLALPKG